MFYVSECVCNFVEMLVYSFIRSLVVNILVSHHTLKRHCFRRSEYLGHDRKHEDARSRCDCVIYIVLNHVIYLYNVLGKHHELPFAINHGMQECVSRAQYDLVIARNV